MGGEAALFAPDHIPLMKATTPSSEGRTQDCGVHESQITNGERERKGGRGRSFSDDPLGRLSEACPLAPARQTMMEPRGVRREVSFRSGFPSSPDSPYPLLPAGARADPCLSSVVPTALVVPAESPTLPLHLALQFSLTRLAFLRRF